MRIANTDSQDCSVFPVSKGGQEYGPFVESMLGCAAQATQTDHPTQLRAISDRGKYLIENLQLSI